jgi:hypothetical protein
VAGAVDDFNWGCESAQFERAGNHITSGHDQGVLVYVAGANVSLEGGAEGQFPGLVRRTARHRHGRRLRLQDAAPGGEQPRGNRAATSPRGLRPTPLVLRTRESLSSHNPCNVGTLEIAHRRRS